MPIGHDMPCVIVKISCKVRFKRKRVESLFIYIYIYISFKLKKNAIIKYYLLRVPEKRKYNSIIKKKKITR